MNQLAEIIKKQEYTLETLMLCTPFESDSDRNLLGHFKEDDFFDNDFYAYPNMPEQINNIENEIKEKETDKNSSEEIESLKAQKKRLESKIENMKSFESIIRTCKFSEDIAYIRSYPGSGKTTYLHKLLHDYKESHSSVVVDFKSFKPEMMISGEDCKEAIFRTEDVDTKNTLVKLIFLLTDALNSLITKVDFEGEARNEKFAIYMQNMYENYKKVFTQNEEKTDLIKFISPFFEIIKQFLSDKDYQCYITNVINYLSTNFKKEHRKNIIFILRLITVVKLCTIKTDDLVNRNYKIILAFDNLEYFIDKDAIYDEDILEIEKILQDFLLSIERFLQLGVQKDRSIQDIFAGHFKIIMLIRDSTNYLRGPRHNDDKTIAILDISDFYSLKEIHLKRYQALNKLGVLDDKEREIYEMIQDIMSDITPYRNSSGISIEEMFNHNKRRITLYLYQILKNEDNRRGYKLLANEAKDDEIGKVKKDILKNASRTYILRLLLDNIQSTSYFSELLAIGENSDDLGKGYARHILTYLHLMNLNNNNNKYVGFYSLLHNVFDKPFGHIKIKDDLWDIIATILKKLNEPEKDSTKWCQLVLIRFEHRQMTKELLIAELKRAYNTKSDDVSNFGIRITEAGSYYLTLMSKFEYFSCRYCPGTAPLHFYENIKPTTASNVSEQSFRCFNCIEKVKKQAIGYFTPTSNERINGCVQEIYNYDKNFFATKRGCNYTEMYKCNYLYKREVNTRSTSQVSNIIINHIGYLDSFRGFILLFNEDSTSDKYLEKKHKLVLAKYILSVIQEYIDVLTYYSDIKDPSGIYYIDNFNLYNSERSVEISIRQLKTNLARAQQKNDEKDITFFSLFE